MAKRFKNAVGRGAEAKARGVFRFAALACVAGAGWATCALASPVEVTYWEKWTRFEGEAMKAVVDDFNRSQDKIFVRYVTMSNIVQKTLIATAGGDPPDLAGLEDANMVSFADKNALTELDGYLKDAGISPKIFIPVLLSRCTYRGKVWAVPTTPATTALHWNKTMFRRAGLDPESPPRTIAELDQMAEKLVIRDKSGKILQMGFLPPEPGWWNWAWPCFFGGRLWDGKDKITCDEPACIEAYKWVQSYARRYGAGPVQIFQSGFGNFASPQNAFLAGRVAMVIQGVWMYNFIKEYSPEMQWGAAPFPVKYSKQYGISHAEADVLAIPRGARHPKEAFEFMKYVIAQGPMEKLCIGQRKFSPLMKVSKAFYAMNPHPALRLFADVARNPLTFGFPQLTFWEEFLDEMNFAFQKIWMLEVTPEQAMADVKRKMQKRLDRELRRLRRLGLEQ